MISAGSMAARRQNPFTCALGVLVLAMAGIFAAIPASAGPPVTEATLVNPQPGDTLCTTLTNPAPGGAGSTYALSGTCHNATDVNVTINFIINGKRVSTTIPAVVKNGTWEANWTMQPGYKGPATITIVPLANGIANASGFVSYAGGARAPAGPVTVNLSSLNPGGSLTLLPSGVISNVYAGMGTPTPLGATSSLALMLQVRFQSHAGASLQTTTLSEPTSNTYVKNGATPTAFTDINNDNAAAGGSPASFILGNNSGLLDGLNTVTADLEDSGSAKVNVNRSIIVDVTPPVVDAGISAGGAPYIGPGRIRLSGVVHDPLNGSGARTTPGGIASVEVLILPHGGIGPDKRTAHLIYSDNPNSPVTWQVDYDVTPGKTYTVQALISDNAGNQTVDPGAGPFTVPLDTTNPAVTINDPIAGAKVHHKIAIDGTIQDVNPYSWTITDTYNTTVTTLASGFGATFSYAWDTATATDGAHTITVNATDLAGNTGSSKVNITTDNTVPTAKITGAQRTSGADLPLPTPYAVSGGAITQIVRDTVTLSGTYVEVNPSIFSVQVDGKSLATKINATAGTFSAVWNTTTSGDGSHVITFTMTDTAGNTLDPASTAVTAKVDNTPPVVTLATPLSNSTVRAGAPATVTVVDANVAPAVSFTFTYLHGTDTAFVNLPATLVANTATVAIPAAIGGFATTTPGSTVTITASASDLADPPHVSKSVPVVVRVEPPAAEIDEIIHPDFAGAAQKIGPPVPGTVYVSRGMTVLGTVDVLNLQSWSLQFSGGHLGSPLTLGSDGPSPTATPIPSTTKLNVAPHDPFDTTGVPDNIYTLALQVNGVTVDSHTVVVDNTNPVVVFTLPTPSAGAVVTNTPAAPLTIAANITEANLATWNILIDGVSRANGSTVNPGGGVSFTPGASVNYLNNGPHTIQVVVLDKAGNQGTTPALSIVVDSTNPVVTINAPANGAFIRTTVPITGSITDSSPGSFVLSDNGHNLLSDNTGATSVNFSWDTTSVLDGSHTLTLKATNKAGLSATATTTVTVDNTPPVVALTAPTPSAHAIVQNQGSSLVTIAGTITEVNLATWNILVDGVSRANGTTIPAGGKVTLTPGAGSTYLNDGAHTVQITAVDKAGNQGASPTQTFIIDNTAPTVTLTAPVSGSYIKGTVAVTGSIADANPASFVLTDNGGPTVPAESDNSGATSLNYQWNTSNIKDGSHTLLLTATDKASNKGHASVTVTVDNTAPVVTFVAPTPSPNSFARNQGSSLVTIAGTITEVNLATWNILVDGVSRANGTSVPAGGKITLTPGAGSTYFSDGAHTVQIVAVDKAGNQGSARVSFIIDNTPPTITLNQPTDGEYIGGAFKISATIADNIKNAQNPLKWSITVAPASGQSGSPVVTPSSGTINPATGSNVITATWNTTVGNPPMGSTTPVIQNGAYIVTVSATDAAGNTTNPPVKVTVQVVNGQPAAALTVTDAAVQLVDQFGLAYPGDPLLTSPNGPFFTKTPDLVLTAIDTNSAQSSYGVLLNSGVLQNSGALLTGPDTIMIKSPPQHYTQSGHYQFQLNASNIHNTVAGLSSAVAAAQLDVTVDRTAPGVLFQSPQGTNFLVIPGSTLPISFTVKKSLTANTAPLKRLENPIPPASPTNLLSAPAVTIVIFEEATPGGADGPIAYTGNLLTALTSPTTQTGAAQVLGDQINGFTVTWQLPVDPTLFHLGKHYRIRVVAADQAFGIPLTPGSPQGPMDILGNMMPYLSYSYGEFVVNVN